MIIWPFHDFFPPQVWRVDLSFFFSEPWRHLFRCDRSLANHGSLFRTTNRDWLGVFFPLKICWWYSPAERQEKTTAIYEKQFEKSRSHWSQVEPGQSGDGHMSPRRRFGSARSANPAVSLCPTAALADCKCKNVALTRGVCSAAGAGAAASQVYGSKVLNNPRIAVQPHVPGGMRSSLPN